MPFTPDQAGRIVGVSDETIRRAAVTGELPTSRLGVRGMYIIQDADLREFARQRGYAYDEEAADDITNK